MSLWRYETWKLDSWKEALWLVKSVDKKGEERATNARVNSRSAALELELLF